MGGLGMVRCTGRRERGVPAPQVSADCAEHVLGLFEALHPDHCRRGAFRCGCRAHGGRRFPIGLGCGRGTPLAGAAPSRAPATHRVPRPQRVQPQVRRCSLEGEDVVGPGMSTPSPRL